jgi:hypothetical protein
MLKHWFIVWIYDKQGNKVALVNYTATYPDENMIEDCIQGYNGYSANVEKRYYIEQEDTEDEQE